MFRNETNEDYTLCSYKLCIEDNSVTSSLSDTLPLGVAKGSVKEIEVTIRYVDVDSTSFLRML